jgi:SAM-dependent methyltransferase/uncharacterized protein YbaR (Trm112 family)
VRREHFAALRPVCPLCRAQLTISVVVREAEDDLLEGILGCTNAACLREYPIVDGIPVLVGPIRAWLAANPLQLLQRDDLSPEMESLIGDVLGPGSPYDTLRQQVSIYAENDATLVEHVPPIGDGPILDIGCAVGGTTFALARRFDRMVLGVDLNFAMLRVASRALREGRLTYARRRVGLVYDRREVDVTPSALVDFWCCDASALPFPDATFALATSLNLVDVVGDPRGAIAECARVVRPGGKAVFSTPYDWTPTATPVEHWLGGHSQRGGHGGASEPVFRALLAESFAIESEQRGVPWRLRLHDRSSIEYLVHVLAGARFTGS